MTRRPAAKSAALRPVRRLLHRRTPPRAPGPQGHAARPRDLLARLAGATPRLVGALALLAATAALGFTALTPSPTETASGTRTGTSAVAAGRTQLAQRLFAERKVRVSRDASRQVLGNSSGRPAAAAGNQAGQRNARFAALASSAEKAAEKIVQNTWQLPIPKGVYRLTARFGECSALWSQCHTGLDFAAPEGTAIQAVANGVVTQAGWAGWYGYRTVVRLEDGTQLWYAHQSSIEVQPGQAVSAGQVIGRVGATGNVTGAHLHLEVRPGGGAPVDPYQALSARGVTP